MKTPPLAEFYERYAPPVDVLRDLRELGELHGLRQRTLEWMGRVVELWSDEELPIAATDKHESVKI